MHSTLLLIIFQAYCVLSSPLLDTTNLYQKRQNVAPDPILELVVNPAGFEAPEANSSGLLALMDATNRNESYKFMGDPRATTALQYLASLFGANRESAGNWPKYLNTQQLAGYGKIADPAGAAPRRIIMPARQNTPNSKTIKLRYGPYKVPSQKVKNPQGQVGMLANLVDMPIEKPCAGKCTIIGMTAGLEYADGKNANINEGLWLHHIVMFNEGRGRTDPACEGVDISVPHVGMNTTSRKSTRFYSVGNERSTIAFPQMGFDNVGYRINESDQWSLLLELMNENSEDKVVYITTVFDILDDHPYQNDVAAISLDIRSCGTSEALPPPGQTKFSISSNWTANIDGEVMGMLGHLHDGGLSTVISIDGKAICTSSAAYGETSDFVGQPREAAMPSGGHSHGANMPHISSMTLCNYPESKGEPLLMKKGQVWTIDANYDFGKFMGMKEQDGSFEEVMGISYVYVKQEAAK